MDILLYYINSVFLKTRCNLVLYSHFYRLESQISNKNITDYLEQSPSRDYLNSAPLLTSQQYSS